MRKGLLARVSGLVVRLGLCSLSLTAAAGAQGGAAKPPPVPPGPPVSQASPEKADTIMTPAQIKALFASVDTVMDFASKDSGLPPVLKVKRRVLGRAEVSAYLVKNFDEDESAKRMQRSEIVLKKFGMLDRDFNLRPFLLSLLTEQIAGFYDAKTKYVNLLNWVDPDDQKPVLAHELTHALQDQKVNLEKWSDNGFKGISHTLAEDNDRVAKDELETARQAVTEGQAMVVFVDYSIRDSGKTLKDVPDLGSKIRESAGDPGGSPIMARAPLVLQRSLLFPYSDGLGFEQAVLIKNGRDAAFAGVLAAPPSSSFEIMTPQAYLAHAPVPVLRMPDVHTLLDADYEPYDVGVMGELDVDMLCELFAGPQLARAIAPQWAGGVYYAAQRRSATPAEKTAPAAKSQTGSLGLVYYSAWKSPEAARAFMNVYAAQLPRKYDGLTERKADETGDGEQVFTTSEGDVLLAITGSGVFVSEGFKLATARKLQAAFTGVQGTGPMREALAPAVQNELGLGLVRTFAELGVMRAGLTR